MSEAANVLESEPTTQAGLERVVARWGGQRPGPMMICVTALHGNEPAGLRASRRVGEALRSRQVEMRGEFIALAGNLQALAERKRYIREDLNRIWWPERIEALRHVRRSLMDEEREMMELLAELEHCIERAQGPVFIFDLHTTSADGVPFAAIEDTLPIRQLAFRFPVPVILGIEEEIGGALMEYLNGRGYRCLTFEGGQHLSEGAVDNHESLIWIALNLCGLIDGGRQEVRRHVERLVCECGDTPCAFEIRYRHGIGPQDHFVMLPGKSNFQQVEKGEVVAHDSRGEVSAPMKGRLVMPLYQQQGEDGFFLGREFNPIWLRVSAWLRRMRLGRIAHWMPGVKCHPEERKRRAGWMIVNPGIARWFAVEVFHLLGYRRHPPEGKYLVFSRRSYDL
ncbi:MAG TPA: succinylglutamate desuccinylase/aspartoacylase family protein [Acidobacteriota bacterium]|nr:succinylglutamate desuccinylase/aspartoacylase family protein [Acidobacteriota bacterium]